MFYKQKLPQNIKSNIKIQLTDFSKGINTKITQNLLPLNYAINSYNFNFNKHGLSTGLGIKELLVPYEVNKTKIFVAPTTVHRLYRFWQYTRYDKNSDSYQSFIILYGDDKNLYSVRLFTSQSGFDSLGVSLSNTPNGVNYRTDKGDCFFACGENKIIECSGSTPVEHVENVPRITSVALHAGRLFATVNGDQNVLWFSDDLDITNWSTSNFEFNTHVPPG